MEFNLYYLVSQFILSIVIGPLLSLWLALTGRTDPKNAFTDCTSQTATRTHQLGADPRLGTDCPYEYILRVYKRNHFAGIIGILDADLETRDPKKYQLILEIMDMVHFAAILVDDVADNSSIRKGKPAAHTLFGSSETINRAYLRLFEILVKTSLVRPELLPFLLQNLQEVHKGQDISLVWRRDGRDSMPSGKNECVAAYRECASLKTGALFRLIGQLVTEDHSKDELMTRVGWYCHLQNDCKNVYSDDYASAKGAFAEDIRNGEYSFPVILALFSSNGYAIRQAFASRGKKGRDAALKALQADEVRNVCLEELIDIADTVPEFVKLWGRKEKMVSGGTMK